MVTATAMVTATGTGTATGTATGTGTTTADRERIPGIRRLARFWRYGGCPRSLGQPPPVAGRFAQGRAHSNARNRHDSP
ncbi:hypothetical protein GCM10009546_44650 [Actinomadura livida]|uniref:Secreted protein n=1 Tax=Actinomadura livida TaxID=79909 RepID=A0ABN1EXW9_9ACTN